MKVKHYKYKGTKKKKSIDNHMFDKNADRRSYLQSLDRYDIDFLRTFQCSGQCI